MVRVPRHPFTATARPDLRGHLDELRLALAPAVDPLEVLDAARAAGRVTDFGLDLPTLSQLFLDAAGHDATPEQQPAGTGQVSQR